MNVNIWDLDGTLCPSIFNNARLKNDNKNCLTSEFMKDLAEVKPFAWVGTFNNRFIGVNIIATGRCQEHETLSKEWFYSATGTGADGFVSVQWDDSFPTREASYENYVARKVKVLADIIDAWYGVRVSGHVDMKVHVYEDDKNVLAKLADIPWGQGNVEYHVIIDGKPPARFDHRV